MVEKQAAEVAGATRFNQPKTSALLRDYVRDFGRVAAFYSASPFRSESYARLAGELSKKTWPRQELAQILHRQNKEFGCGEPTLSNIEKLKRPETMAVVTGQQAGLFSGPVFTLYKALTALRLAQRLEEQGIPTVPVFWLATEDHDFEEIATTNILDESYQIVGLRDEGERPAASCSVGYIKLSAQIPGILDELEAAVPASEARDAVLHDLRQAYRAGEPWGRAFGRLMTRLFGKWGVVMLDPLDAEVHQLCRPVYEKAAAHADEIRRCLAGRSQELVRAGYHAQVHVAEDSTLIFKEIDGNRRALHHRDGKTAGQFFDQDGKSFDFAEIKAALEASPLEVSSNVLLRPIVQDTLLPTIAYAAGPSELAYFGQAQVLYGFYGRPMPVIFPRASFTLLDARVQRILEKYQLLVEDVWQGEEHLGGKIAGSGFAAGWAERFDQSEKDLGLLLERMRKDVEVLDPTLLDALKHAEEKIKFQVERLKGKVSRAALGKSDVLKRHEQLLSRYIFPAKDLQERQISGIYFLGRSGYSLLDRLLAEIKTDLSQHQILTI